MFLTNIQDTNSNLGGISALRMPNGENLRILRRQAHRCLRREAYRVPEEMKGEPIHNGLSLLLHVPRICPQEVELSRAKSEGVPGRDSIIS